MSAVARFGGKIPTICAGCQRLAGASAFAPYKNGRGPHIWWCDECQKKIGSDDAEKIYKMPSKKMELWEGKANREAGAEAGAYLDEIGAGLVFEAVTESQWNEFLRRFVVAREKSLRRQIINNEAPF